MESESKRPSDGKQNSNMMWFTLVLILTVVMCAVFVFLRPTQHRLTYDEFWRLVEKTQYNETGLPVGGPDRSASISIRRGDKTYRYSDLSDIRVGELQIQGQVKFED
jgi:YD repeat-containing protein